jgi:hypothetical protein
MRLAELPPRLFCRQAQVVHQSLAGTHEVILRSPPEPSRIFPAE